MADTDLVIDKALTGLYTKVFDSSEGQRVLQDLMLRFHAIDRLVLPESERKGIPIDPLETHIKIGEHGVIMHILACVEGNKVGRFKERIAKAMRP